MLTVSGDLWVGGTWGGGKLLMLPAKVILNPGTSWYGWPLALCPGVVHGEPTRSTPVYTVAISLIDCG